MYCTSSFNGVISEIPGIMVDNFETLNKRAYFLSHCHRDHIQGLSNVELTRYLMENNVYIYTSEISAAIISATADLCIAKPFVKTLKLGHPTLVKLPSIGNTEETYIEVTLIPAGHCFGSVMFLFRNTLNTILFTGDFRLTPNDVSKLGHLHENGEPINIDKMYVDTTFLRKEYDSFPKRTECVDYVVGEIKKWLDEDVNNYIALHMSARFGYEYVFNEIYKCIGVKVYMPDKDWDLYRDFKDSVPGVTNLQNEPRIHKCTNRSEKYSHYNCLPFDTSSKKFLYIHLSAMKWEHYETEQPMFKKVSKSRIDLCFSTHCSRNELIYFVTYFSPKKVVGFPNEYAIEDVKKDNIVYFKASKKRKSKKL